MRSLIIILRKIPFLYSLAYASIRFFFRIKERWINYDYDKKAHPSVSLEKIRAYNQNRTYGPSKYICNAPYTNMHFRFNGDVNACCFNKNHSFGNVGNKSLKEIWNSADAGELRRYIDDYNLDHGCKFCKYQLEAGNHSGMYASVFDELPFTSHRRSAYPSEMTFEITNVCNLECLMCTGDYSNLIRKNREGRPAMPLLYKENFVEELKEFLPHLKKATFLGGEPLLIKTYFEIWHFLAQQNPSCRIHLQTNATILNEEFKKLLAGGQFSIGISIDAWDKKLFESIRKNAKWETVMEHFDYFCNLYRENIIDLSLNFCPLMNNWQELPKIIDVANERNIPLTILTVIIPPYLSLKNVTAEKLERIIAELKKYQPPTGTAVSQRNKESFDGFIAQLQNWLAERKQRATAAYENISPAETRSYFENQLFHAAEISHFTDVEKEDVAACVAEALAMQDDAVRLQTYRTMIRTMDYFFDDSLEKLDAAELKEGFKKFIRWELDGVKYHKEIELQDA